ncbi:hypothetical protein RJ640_011066 [Escallonia rubra]|uniref:Cytochrome P450 n=1 Tax=Escallonia rubra TaxID=112253 RepID=A0AA88RPP4_9ASTE|nr:hypothetical protein RJ640_011066 [Escallonia rubra]
MKRYSSRVFKTSLLGQPMAFLSGAEGNKFLFSNENKLVQVWWPSSIEKLFPSAHINPRKMLSSVIKVDALRKLVGTTDVVMKQHLQTSWDRDEVNVSLVAKTYTFALACRLFLGIDDAREVQKIVKPIDDMSRGILSIGVNFPGTAFRRAINASRAIHEDIERMIKQRKIDLSEKRATPTQDILSQMLLSTDENGQFAKEADIASSLVGFLHGGYGTVTAALTFIMKYLAEHPDVYDEVLKEQTEIAKSKESKELLNWEDLRRMRYSWNVANEVLRMTPPVFGTFRKAITDFNYAGYMIPKGWKLHWIAHDTHKNPVYFPNPEKFIPSRFEGNGPPPYTFVPFGGGPRMCPGNEYTRMVILVFLHNVVMKFRWEKVIPNEKIVSDPNPRPSQGLPIRLRPHKH